MSDDCGTPKQNRTIATQTTGLLAGIGGGTLASYGICSVLFGIPSGGTSFFWCAAVAGTGGAIVASQVGSKISGELYDHYVDKDIKIPPLN